MVNQQAARVCPAATESLPLLDAVGRVLAEPVLADRDQPPFPRSTRDGFAASAADWREGGLAVLGLLRAGETWENGPVEPGTCVEIMTGAPVPPGADSVVMIEHIERSGDTVAIAAGSRRVVEAGANIVPAGAEAKSGSVLLPRGARITAHGVAVAAACGYASVSVFTKPRVAILSTGDELVGVAETPLQHQIRNSNSYTLAAQVRALGGVPVLAKPVADDAGALVAAIRNASEVCDLLLLSGGVSMGKYDLVEPALAALGGTFHFTGARIEPCKPVVFGSMVVSTANQPLPFFGLPGNPVSTIVCFSLFVAPLLAALAGETAYEPRFVQARLDAALRAKPGLTRFLPALLTHRIEQPSVEVIAWQGSGDLASTARANCFLVAPDAETDLAAGSNVTVLLG